MTKSAAQIAKANVDKSKRHERKVAAFMSQWTGRPFRRRKVEGHDESTIKVDSTSDVIPVEGDVVVTIEAKSGKDFSMTALLSNIDTSLFTKWWKQCSIDSLLLSNAKGYKVYPMLHFKPNVNTDWVAIDCKLIDDEILRPKQDIKYHTTPWFPCFKYNGFDWAKEIIYGNHKLTLSSCYLMDSKDLVKYIDGNSIFM